MGHGELPAAGAAPAGTGTAVTPPAKASAPSSPTSTGHATRCRGATRSPLGGSDSTTRRYTSVPLALPGPAYDSRTSGDGNGMPRRRRGSPAVAPLARFSGPLGRSVQRAATQRYPWPWVDACSHLRLTCSRLRQSNRRACSSCLRHRVRIGAASGPANHRTSSSPHGPGSGRPALMDASLKRVHGSSRMATNRAH